MKKLSEKLNTQDITYVKNMCADLVKSLALYRKHIEDCDGYVFQNSERARFKRLRVELGKKLMEIQKAIY